MLKKYIYPCTQINNNQYRQSQVFQTKGVIIDNNQSGSDLDEDNIIHSVDSKKSQKKKNRKKRNDQEEMKYNEKITKTNHRNNSLEYDDLDTVDSLSVTTIGSPGKNKGIRNDKKYKTSSGNRTKRKSKKSQNRNKSRNQIAFYATLTAAAVVVFGLAKFYWSTHQSGDTGGGGGGGPSKEPAIDFRKK